MKRTGTLAAVSLAMTIALAPGPAEALNTISVTVDCATTSLADLINGVAQRPSVAAVLTIKGTCTEDIAIEFDDVTLKGDPVDGGTISGTITIKGARRVVIDDLTVTGPGDGIVGIDNAAFTVRNSDISNNSATEGSEGSGIVVVNSSSANITGSTISSNAGPGVGVFLSASAFLTSNQIINNIESGILVGDAGSVDLTSNTIQSTGPCGIQAEAGGAVELEGGNTVTSDGRPAICLFLGGTVVAEGETADTFTQLAAGLNAIEVFEGSAADFESAIINGNVLVVTLSLFTATEGSLTGDVEVSLLSSFDVNNVPIIGNVNASGVGFVSLRGTTTVSGTVTCDGSSFCF